MIGSVVSVLNKELDCMTANPNYPFQIEVQPTTKQTLEQGHYVWWACTQYFIFMDVSYSSSNSMGTETKMHTLVKI